MNEGATELITREILGEKFKDDNPLYQNYEKYLKEYILPELDKINGDESGLDTLRKAILTGNSQSLELVRQATDNAQKAYDKVIETEANRMRAQATSNGVVTIEETGPESTKVLPSGETIYYPPSELAWAVAEVPGTRLVINTTLSDAENLRYKLSKYSNLHGNLRNNGKDTNITLSDEKEGLKIRFIDGKSNFEPGIEIEKDGKTTKYSNIEEYLRTIPK